MVGGYVSLPHVAGGLNATAYNAYPVHKARFIEKVFQV